MLLIGTNNLKLVYFHISNATFLCSAAFHMSNAAFLRCNDDRLGGFKENAKFPNKFNSLKRNADKTLFMKSFKTFSIFVNKGNNCD